MCAANEPLLGMAVVVNGMGSMFSLLAYAERERQRERARERESDAFCEAGLSCKNVYMQSSAKKT